MKWYVNTISLINKQTKWMLFGNRISIKYIIQITPPLFSMIISLFDRRHFVSALPKRVSWTSAGLNVYCKYFIIRLLHMNGSTCGWYDSYWNCFIICTVYILFFVQISVFYLRCLCAWPTLIERPKSWTCVFILLFNLLRLRCEFV